MKYQFLFILFITTFLFISGTTSDSGGPERDFEAFYCAIHSKEGTLDLHLAADSLESYFTALKEDLGNETDLFGQFKLYSKTLSKIQCGHTQIYPDKNLFQSWIALNRSLPIDYYFYDGKLYISDLEEADQSTSYSNRSNKNVISKIPQNAELYAINGMTLDSMMVKIGDFISSDEDQVEFKKHQAGQLFEFYRNLALPDLGDTVRLTYVSFGDTVRTALIIGEAPIHTIKKRITGSLEDENNRGAQYGEFKIIRDEFAYFRFRSFNACVGTRYKQFLKDSFKKIRDKGISKLVIDLRGNTGGVMQYELMSYMVGPKVLLGKYIVAKPSFSTSNKYIKKVNIDFIRHKKMSKNQRRELRKGNFNEGLVYTESVDTSLVFHGEVVVITDESTFSSAAMLACHLKTLKNAKLIGRTTGGSFYRGNSGTLHVKMPESGFDLIVNPNTFYSQLEPVSNPRAIKEPDVVLHPEYLPSRKLEVYYFGEATKLFSQN